SAPVNQSISTVYFNPETGRSNLLDSLDRLNEEFRRIYAETRRHELDKSGPIIVVKEGKEILLKVGKRSETSYHTEQYRILKTADHTTLATYLLLKNHTNKPLSEEQLASVKIFKHYAEFAIGDLGNYGFSETTLARQREIMQQAIDFMDKVI